MANGDLILTVLAPRLSADIQAQVNALIGQFGLQEISTQRLADRQQGEGIDCVEQRLVGGVDVEAVRNAALVLSETLGVDIVIQADTRDHVKPRLVCFDMDSTLIKAEVIDELARRHGVGEEVAEVTERAMRGELDFKASFRERMSKLAGLNESVLAEIAEELPLMEGVERLMANLKRLGYRTAILSGGFTYFAHHLQEKLGFDEIHANELIIEEGKVTGAVSEPIVDAERKAALLETIALREGFSLDQTIAVGDGANDLKMLAKAGLGIAFRAKPLVRAQARQAISSVGLDGVLYLLGYHQQNLTP
ncbi:MULTISPECIES: phosphoserine phosphatase SerB [unclassified Halomonas]|uniref:phosphoserine phosphatase SerB n=1 Tax=unclassified Halomonas TaxID=2609666 RepID=UPI0007D964E1|nr:MULTISPECIES: phosphoserine phosphatase SerB [unclassified Halomonas]MBT2787412.1 phosphoserine phosphatase SerB [Halomonas sp. ISL-106]MBT2796226.1 phosphoserine phosphatase SerB [Halomonas sp. ISL-104]OAL57620.1 phosphoserine phosphatase SerB [Halomonas sp. ALS9]